MGIVGAEPGNAVVQLVARCGDDPGPLHFPILPEALEGIELGTLGRPAQPPNSLGNHQCFCGMTATILHQDDLECFLIMLGTLIQQ
jgi:hypothetical protein